MARSVHTSYIPAKGFRPLASTRPLLGGSLLPRRACDCYACESMNSCENAGIYDIDRDPPARGFSAGVEPLQRCSPLQSCGTLLPAAGNASNPAIASHVWYRKTGRYIKGTVPWESLWNPSDKLWRDFDDEAGLARNECTDGHLAAIAAAPPSSMDKSTLSAAITYLLECTT